jgi:hypothetical protein
MKQFFVFLFVCGFPLVGFGLGDACTKPDKYTIDKRCYVTRSQKREKPYNSVVYFKPSVNQGCSGVLVKENQQIYLYTAKHCFKQNVKNSMTVSTSTNRAVNVILDAVSQDRDFIKYTVKKENVDFVDIVEKSKNLREQEVLVVGYGGLEILSDKTIEDFQTKYINYLKQVKGVTVSDINENYGVFDNGAISYQHEKVKEFLAYLAENDEFFYNRVDIDNKGRHMKMSRCTYYTSGFFDGCQAVVGDSGGGMFDSNGDLIGIVIKAYSSIGGENTFRLGRLEEFRKD